MVKGVTEGFKETVVLEGVGYRAQVQGNQVTLTVGYSHPVILQPLEGVRVEAETPTRLVLSGMDKEAVGQSAANLKAVRPMFRYIYKDGRVKGIRLSRDVLRYKHQRKMGA
jgi:large subunit ribosomal protein L6